jgi:hypothetical protein
MVLPEAPDKLIGRALSALGIELLLFTRQGNAVCLERDALRKLIGKQFGKARAQAMSRKN